MKAKNNIHDLTRRFILVVLFVTPFVFTPFSSGHDYFYAPKVYFYTLVVGLFLVFLLFNQKAISTIIHKDSINVFLAIYALLLIISTVFALDSFQALTGSFRRVEGLSTMLVYFLLFLMARASAPLKDKHVDLFLLVVTIIALYGVLQTFMIDPFPRDYIREGWTRAFSTIGNPNFLGSYLALAIPLAIHRYINHRKWYALLFYAIMLYTLLATMTRGTWIGAVISIIIYFGFVWYQRNRKPFSLQRVIYFLLTTLIVILTYNGLSDGGFLARLLTIGADVTTIIEGSEVIDRVGSSRMFIWLKTIDLIQIRPLFGFGLENLGLAFHQYFSSDIVNHWGRLVTPDKAHNEYLHIAVTSGIPALLVYLSFIGLVIKKGWKNLFHSSMGLGLFVAIVGYLVQAFFNISVVSVAYVFWIFLGLWTHQH